MTIAGNLFLFIASLVYIGLLCTTWGKQPHSGDSAVGYGWTVLLLNAILIILLSITTSIIAVKGGFSWVASTSVRRFFIVSIVLVATLFTTAMCSILKNEHGPVPVVIRGMSAFFPMVIPLVLIVSSVILLNDITVNKSFYQYPLIAVSIFGLVGFASGISLWIYDSIQKEQRQFKSMQQDMDNNHKRILDEIDSCDVTKNILFILVFTDSNQEPVIKEKAVAKIKTNSAWQQELIRLLKTGWAPQAFTFLASNAVDSSELFIEPVKEGILQQAKLIREDMRNTNNFYPELFLWETERILKTIGRFPNTDFTTEIKKLRASLDEPSSYKETKLACVDILDNWVKKKR